jgi:hypothetical protein
MTRAPFTDIGPALRNGSPRQQSRLHARRRENEASNPLGGRRASAPGNYLCQFALALLAMLALAALRRSRRRQRPAPAIHRLVAADELRFAALCLQITHARQGVPK